MAQLTRITFWNDYFRPHFDIVPVTMYQQGRRNAERSLLLFVQQHRPSAGTLEPHHPRQRESVQELAQRHVPAAGPFISITTRLATPSDIFLPYKYQKLPNVPRAIRNSLLRIVPNQRRQQSTIDEMLVNVCSQFFRTTSLPIILSTFDNIFILRHPL